MKIRGSRFRKEKYEENKSLLSIEYEYEKKRQRKN